MTVGKKAHPRWPVAVALLNLTGLGLGYLYIKRWLRWLVHLLLTLGLVALAYWIAALRFPLVWAAIFGLWLLWMVFDGWRLAQRPVRTSSEGPVDRPWLPVVLALLIVGLEVGAFWVYAALGQREFTAGRVAYELADCRTAMPYFSRVTAIYKLTFSRNTSSAAARNLECSIFLFAENAQDRGEYANATTGYQTFLHQYPNSVLAPVAQAAAAVAYSRWADQLQGDGDYQGAIDKYQTILNEYPQTSVGGEAATLLAETYAGWAARLRENGAYEEAIAKCQIVLNEYPDMPVGREAATLAAETYGQWAAELRERHGYEEAIDRYKMILAEYPDTSIGQQANALLAETYADWSTHMRQEGAYEAAISKYQVLLNDYPGTPIGREAATLVAETYGQWAAELRSAHGYDEAIARYQAILDEYPDTSIGQQANALAVETYADWAIRLRETQRYAEAIDKYQIISNKYPDSATGKEADILIAETYAEWAAQLREAGEYEDAIAKCELIVNTYPDTSLAVEGRVAEAKIYYEWGSELLKTGLYSEGIEKYQIVANQFSDVEVAGEAQAAVGSAYLDWGNKLRSRQKYSEAMEKFALASGEAAGNADLVAAAEQGYQEALSALSQDTQGEGKEIMEQTLSGVCAGKPATSPAIGLVEDEPGKALMSSSEFALPKDLMAVEPAHFRFVVCLETGVDVIERCPYADNHTRIRQQLWWRIQVRDTRSARVVAEKVFSGSMPDTCPFIVWVPTGSEVSYEEGSAPSSSEVIEWLRGVLR